MEKVNIYTDSKYAFVITHAHQTIWKERGLLIFPNNDIKYSQEILWLLEAIYLPADVVIMHYPGYQKGNSQISRGNWLADATAKIVAKNSHSRDPWVDLSAFKPQYRQ